MRVFALLLVTVSAQTWSNPYPNPERVPKIHLAENLNPTKVLSKKDNNGTNCMRVLLSIDSVNEKYSLHQVKREKSCTQAFFKRTKKISNLGSYRALIRKQSSGEILGYDSIGTGKEFRKLVNQLNFRFVLPNQNIIFELQAENPNSGLMEKVFETIIEPSHITQVAEQKVEVREIQKSASKESLNVNIYAEGYTENVKEIFFKDSQKIVDAFKLANVPAFDRFDFYAIFSPSKLAIGKPENLGLPVPQRDSFLGLYFPYTWSQGRWYHVLYPTREEKFRNALAQWPYDYPIALVKSSQYWGVGNYKELTAIPSDHPSIVYLLLHEFGHFMGLNEEYSEGGPTELEFAKNIYEPWSQNITFLREPAKLKWMDLVDKSTPIPTNDSYWNFLQKRYGAYKGGYAQSEGSQHSHKIGKSCIMENASSFCPVCSRALTQLIEHDSN